MALMEKINMRQPSFVVHLGDFKSGRTDFKSNLFKDRRVLFSAIHAPLIYTPGDNDWVDGNSKVKSIAKPMDRLRKLRRTFYQGDSAKDDAKLWVIRQEGYPENAWWMKDDVLFIALHTIGKNNNRSKDRAEFNTRNGANLSWLSSSISEVPHKAIVIFTHANLWQPGRRRTVQAGFAPLVDQIGEIAASRKVPLLVMHGDKHKFLVDHPSSLSSDALYLSDLTRVQVMGDDDIRAVEITVTGNGKTSFTVRSVDPQ